MACIFYPLRSVIRCVAKAHLLVMPEDPVAELDWDEGLFNDLLGTLLQPSTQPLLISPCQSRHEATVVEEQLAKSVVSAYRCILQQRQDIRVKRLNGLL